MLERPDEDTLLPDRLRVSKEVVRLPIFSLGISAMLLSSSKSVLSDFSVPSASNTCPVSPLFRRLSIFREEFPRKKEISEILPILL